MADDTTYPEFLGSLDESQLLAHIRSLSQISQNESTGKQEVPEKKKSQENNESLITSTPVSRARLQRRHMTRPADGSFRYGSVHRSRRSFLGSASSLASDPFDDNLDSQLLKLDPALLYRAPAPVAGLPNASSARASILLSGSSVSDGPVPGNQLALLPDDYSAAKVSDKWKSDKGESDKGESDKGESDKEEYEQATENDDADEDAVVAKPAMRLWSRITISGEYLGNSMNEEDPGDIEKVVEGTGAIQNDDLLYLDGDTDFMLENEPPGNEVSNEQDLLEESQIPVDAADETFAEVGPEHKFGDYAAYFENKSRKQQISDRDFIRWERQRRVAMGQSADIPQIFTGCRIFVNGNTNPTLSVIHRLVILHGGTFLSHVANKSAATHIICDRLTPRKRTEFRNYKVVRGKWIADCVEKERLLDWKEYRLIDDLAPLQKRLGFSKVSQDPEFSEGGVVEGQSEIQDIMEEAGSGLDEIGDYGGGYEASPLEVSRMTNPGDDDINPFLDKPQNTDDSMITRQDEAFSETTNPLLTELGPDPVPSNLSQLNVSKPRQAFAQMDAKHPDFLKHFFANSRLHHLSTWKADLKSKFLRLIARGYEGPPKVVSAQPIIMHIDFDCFFATASALKHPNLDMKTDPIAVSHGGKSSDIASCNYVARSFGVSNGMWLGRALEKCPGLKVVDYDFEAYEKFSHAFYSYLVSKKIFDTIFPVSIDEVLVDATSFCHGEDLVSKVNELCAEIRRDIFSLTQCPVSIGAGSNVLLAKLAIREAKPDGHFFLHENIQEFLDKTDVRQLPGVGGSLAGRIGSELGHSEMGPILIAEVRQSFTKERLVKTLGDKTGVKVFENCHGQDSTKIQLDLSSMEALLGRKTVSVDVNYGIRFDLFAEAENFLISLAKELHSRLIDIGACGSGITLKIAKRAPDAPVVTPKFMGLGKCVFVSRSSSLGTATNDWGIIGSEMKALFRSFNIPPQELRGIAVSMSKLEDVEVVKKQRQQKLVFTRKLAEKKNVPPPVLSQNMPFAERVTGVESVDWEVFNQLPDEIRRELKKELLRRGIPVSGYERSPSKKNSDGSVSGPKVYLQQVFPTQPNGEFKVKRVIESPTKKRKIKESPKKSPVKQELPVPVYNDTVSYDEEVLQEIPSSIRNEFMQELEWQKKHKSLGFVSIRAKMEQKSEEERKLREQVLDAKWLRAQKRAVDFEAFNSVTDYHQLVAQVQDWVRSSATDEGPHPEDVAMFEKYLSGVFERGGVSRIANLLKAVSKELDKQESMYRLCGGSDAERAALRAGIDDWRRCSVKMQEKLRKSCAKMNIVI